MSPRGASLRLIHGRGEMELSILIADDDSEFCRMMQKIFEKEFPEAIIYICENGHDAYKVFCKERPEIVILDVMMPVQNGWQACKRIRAFEKNQNNGQRAIIIIVTCIDPNLNEMTSHLYGADAFLDKPIKIKDLFATINEIKTQR